MSDATIRELERALARQGRSPLDYALEIVNNALHRDGVNAGDLWARSLGFSDNPERAHQALRTAPVVLAFFEHVLRGERRYVAEKIRESVRLLHNLPVLLPALARVDRAQSDLDRLAYEVERGRFPPGEPEATLARVAELESARQHLAAFQAGLGTPIGDAAPRWLVPPAGIDAAPGDTIDPRSV